MRIVVIVQARTSSTRLPGKILKPVLGKPVLLRQIERMQRAILPSDIVVATSSNSDDDIIAGLCATSGIGCFRGSLGNLLDRHYRAARAFNADVSVKIPSDCPLIDPAVIDRVLQYYLDNSGNFDFVSNLHPATYPDGNDVEIMPMQILEQAWHEAEKDYELEHTTPFIWDNPEKFMIGNVEWETGLDYSMSHRLTLDYQEDYEFINNVYEALYPSNPAFSLNDILNLLESRPDIMQINSKYAGVNWYRNNIGELKTVDLNSTKFI